MLIDFDQSCAICSDSWERPITCQGYFLCMSGDWTGQWKPQFDNRIASLFEMYDHEMGDASFNTPHQEMESPSFHAAHNPTQVGADWPALNKGSVRLQQ